MPKIRKLKVCATCGKAEGQHWAKHWKKRHPTIEPRELLPGEAPTQPFDSNWIYLIKDETTREQFLKGLDQVLIPSQNINQQPNNINNQEPPQPLHHPLQITNQSDQLASLEQIQVYEDEKEQEANSLDFSSTPNQELFKIAERTLQEIKDRLAAKQKALDKRLTYALDTSQSIQERYVSRIYQPQVGCHPSISRALPIEQVDTPFSTKDVISFEGFMMTSMAPESRQLIDRIIKEQERVRTQTNELECAIKCLRVISLPTDLTLNNCQADVQLATNKLSKRQRMLLRPIKQVAATNQPDPQPSNIIKLTPEEERAITYPHLHGSALERIQEQPIGPKNFVVDDLVDIGDDIKEGVNSVDGARHLLTLARKKVGDLKYSRHLKERLLTLIKYQRDHISRGLQHFLNMVLLPYPTINMVKTKVTLVFNSPFMKDRTFTVSDISKDRRNFTKSSTVSLRSLTAATNSISETTSAILDFTEALEKLEIAEEDSLIIMPLMKEVINAVRGASGDIMMKGIHRMMRLQKVLTRVATRLQDPNLLSDLKEEDSKKKYWTKVNLTDHVKMVMRQQRENAA